MRLPTTPPQTVGPFFHFALEQNEHLVGTAEPDAIRIVGTVFDGAGDPVPDGMVEIWQADRDGGFGDGGFGRSFTDADGGYRFTTVKPGTVPAPDGRPQAPHIDVAVYARGVLRQLVTRLYFPDEAEANAADPLLALVDHPDRLVARRDGDALRFDVHLQGDLETPFLDV